MSLFGMFSKIGNIIVTYVIKSIFNAYVSSIFIQTGNKHDLIVYSGVFLIKNKKSELCNDLCRAVGDGVENWLCNSSIKAVGGSLFIDLCKLEIKGDDMRWD